MSGTLTADALVGMTHVNVTRIFFIRTNRIYVARSVNVFVQSSGPATAQYKNIIIYI